MSDSLFSREFNCPSCGGPIPQKYPGSRTLLCPYCGQTSHLNADSIEAAGGKHLLIDYGSELAVGQQYRIPHLKTEVMILGRLRIDYEDGFWDEWFAQTLDEGQPLWIQEDDGQFMVFQEQEGLDELLSYENARVGFMTRMAEGVPEVLITSKSRAQVNGGEGELPFRVIPGDPADFVEGMVQGRVLSAELLPGERHLFVGTPITLESMQPI